MHKYLQSADKAQLPEDTIVPTPRVTVAQSPRDTVTQSPRDTIAQSPRDTNQRLQDPVFGQSSVVYQ